MRGPWALLAVSLLLFSQADPARAAGGARAAISDATESPAGPQPPGAGGGPDEQPFLSDGEDPPGAETLPAGPLPEDAAGAGAAGLPAPGGGGPDGEEQPFLSGEEAPAGGQPPGDGAEKGKEEGRFSFDHRYRTGASVNETSGIFNFLTGNDTIQQFQLVNAYEQTIRIEGSGDRVNFVKFSIDFTQSYEAKSKQFLDNQVLFSEIYHGVTSGKHRLFWGNQIFRLGKVDFESPIDVLHVQSLFSLMTFDPAAAKKSLTSIKYDWSSASRTFTFYAAPVGQRTFGMKFTRARDDADLRDRGEQPEGEFLLRDYAGVQHQWSGNFADLRLGLFHWFDRNPTISWKFLQSTEEDAESSFEGLFNSYREEESLLNFATFELDATLGGLGWKTDMGYFDRKNFYDYRIEEDDSVRFNTVSVPYFGLATSWEVTFSKAFLLLAYHYDALERVPANSHILFFENEAVPLDYQRDLVQQGLTGVFIWRHGERWKTTFVLGRSSPFEVTRAVAKWSSSSPARDSGEWSVALIHLATATQKFTGRAIVSDQVRIGYSIYFSGLRSGQ